MNHDTDTVDTLLSKMEQTRQALIAASEDLVRNTKTAETDIFREFAAAEKAMTNFADWLEDNVRKQKEIYEQEEKTPE